MRKRKFLAVITGVVMCTSMLSFNVSADNGNNGELSELCENVNTAAVSDEAMQEIGSYSAAYPVESVQGSLTSADCIAEEYPNDNISVYGANSAPVAGLTYMIANADTLVNGKISTEIIIFWMWNDGENVYSYDPDGGQLANYYVRGINSYIIGNVTIGDNVVGFATKVTQAGPHELQFQVADSEGNLSNIVSYSFTVEPADGSARPVCNVTVADDTPFTGDYVYFDWSGSSISGDSISSVSIRVDNKSNPSSSASTSDYLVANSTTAALLTFNDPGKYDVNFQISDSRDAWSDWATCTVYVKENVGQDIRLDCPDWDDTYTEYHSLPFDSDRTVYMSKLRDVRVCSKGIKLKSYTNWKGTYNYVVAYEVAPETLFAYSKMTHSNGSSSGDGNVDPVFNKSTPRRLTWEEIGIIRARDKENENFVGVVRISVIYDPKTGTIVDFYSLLNPIIFYGRSTPTYIIDNN